MNYVYFYPAHTGIEEPISIWSLYPNRKLDGMNREQTKQNQNGYDKKYINKKKQKKISASSFVIFSKPSVFGSSS